MSWIGFELLQKWRHRARRGSMFIQPRRCTVTEHCGLKEVIHSSWLYPNSRLITSWLCLCTGWMKPIPFFSSDSEEKENRCVYQTILVFLWWLNTCMDPPARLSCDDDWSLKLHFFHFIKSLQSFLWWRCSWGKK